MVRKIRGIEDVLEGPSRTFDEFSLLTGYTPKGCTIESVSLEQDLCGLTMKAPLLSAAMMSVTGFELALELARNGGLGVVPASLSVDEQVAIIRGLKEQDMPLIEDYVFVLPNEPVFEVLRKAKEHGHSTIPVVDKFRNFLGIFDANIFNQGNDDAPLKVASNSPISDVMQPAKKLYSCREGMSLKDMQKKFSELTQRCIPIVNRKGQLVRLAFKRDIENPQVAAAASSQSGWEERVEACINAGADMIVFDSSHGFNYYQEKTITQYKKNSHFKHVPVCGGNVITAEGFRCLAKAGADAVKVGMSIGSICITAGVKGTGRGQFTAVYEAVKARDEFCKRRKYIPIIADGGISFSGQMVIALTIADFLMMGNYFNRFYEAAGEALDEHGNVIDRAKEPSRIKYIATWGEGSERAKNHARYGHITKRTLFAEGVEGRVGYAGRMKPNLRRDVNAIKAALRDTGSMDLPEFRKKAVIELRSEHSLAESQVHGVQDYK